MIDIIAASLWIAALLIGWRTYIITRRIDKRANANLDAAEKALDEAQAIYARIRELTEQRDELQARREVTH